MPQQTITQAVRPVQTLAPSAPSPAAVAKRRSAMASLASRLDVEPAALMKVLKSTVFAKARTDEEFAALCIVANKYCLDPITKEIFAFPSNDGGIVPIVSIDGWSKIANQQPAFDGCEFDAGTHPDFGPFITCRVYRRDRSHPTCATEYLEECRGNSTAWRKTPMRMLRHRAFIQAVRLAFGFSGIYAPEDGDPAEGLPPAAQDPRPYQPAAQVETVTQDAGAPVETVTQQAAAPAVEEDPF